MWVLFCHLMMVEIYQLVAGEAKQEFRDHHSCALTTWPCSCISGKSKQWKNTESSNSFKEVYFSCSKILPGASEILRLVSIV